MSDVTITYKGANIATMDTTGSKTLQTAGTYCEGDIGVEYVKPGGAAVEPLSVTQNGVYTAPTGSAYSPVTVNVSGGALPVAQSKDVDFIDYDGTIRYSYTADEFAALAAMPANPDHSGDEIPLTSQGWNWSLASAKTYVAKYGRLVIGQLYIPTDRKTHIKINVPPGRRTIEICLARVSVTASVTVSWGDGSSTSYNFGTSIISRILSHTYSHGGYYDVGISVDTGTIRFYGTAGDYTVYGSQTNSNAYARSLIHEVFVGANVTSVSQEAFRNCYALSVFTFTSDLLSIEAGAFRACYSLKCAIFPPGMGGISADVYYGAYSMSVVSVPGDMSVIQSQAFRGCYALETIFAGSSIGANAYQGCYSAKNVVMRDDITAIPSNAFNACYSLTVVTIPSTVTSIAASAFTGCYGVAEYHILPTTPPTLSNTNAFSGIASDCVMYVPYSADHSILNAYKTATNWSTYASQMQEEPQ